MAVDGRRTVSTVLASIIRRMEQLPKDSSARLELENLLDENNTVASWTKRDPVMERAYELAGKARGSK